MDSLRDLAINLLAALIGFVVARVSTRIGYLRKTRLTRRLWGSFTSGGPIEIVLPVFESDQFVRWEATGLVGTGDVRGILELQKALLSIDREYDVIEAGKLHGTTPSQDLIVIGGPDANLWTKAALDLLGPRVEIGQDDAWGAVTDLDSGESYNVVEHTDGTASKDLGIVISAKNPFALNGTIIILAGVWGYGTQGAVKLVTTSVGKLYGTGLDVSEPFEVIFSVPVVNKNALEPTVEVARNSTGATRRSWTTDS